MKKVLLIVFLFFLFFKSNAQIILGSDNAGNYSTWSNGSNHGTGFGNWDMWSTGTAGFFLGSSNASGFGNIDTSSKSFGMYGNTGSGDYSNAQRFLSSVTGSSANSGRYHLLSGQSFEIDLAIAYRNGNKGIDLLNDSYNLLYTVYVTNHKYMVTGGEINPVWAYSQTSIIHIKVWQISDTQMRVMLTRGSDSFDSGVISGVFSGFKLFEGNTSSGVLNNLYFNNLVVKSGDIVTTWDGTAWDNGTPNELKKAVINGNFTSNGTDQLPFTAQSLTINADKILTISAEHAITIQNAITNNGTVIIENEASIVQSHSGVDANPVGSGTYQVYKASRPYHEYDYNYWSSPIENASINTVFNANSSLLAGSGDAFSEASRIYELNTAAFADDTPEDTWDDDLNDWIVASGNMTKGKGYIALGAGADFPFNAGDFENNLKQQIRFDGSKVHNGTFTYTLSDDIDVDNGPSDNLIGNPYPSALDATSFYNANIGVIGSTGYFWTHDTQIAAGGGPWAYNFTNSDYATFNLSTGAGISANSTPVNKYIASGQGFIVQLLRGSSSNDITFSNAMRATDNTHFVKMSNQIPDIAWLNLTDNTGLYRQLAVGFFENGLDTFETSDSKKMFTVNEPEFYSLMTDETDKLAIQGLSSFEVNKTVSLGLTTTYSGDYEISLDHTQGIFSQTQKIYLEDTYQDIIHNLSDGPYTFTQTAGTNINDRFILRFTNTQLGHEEAVLEDLKLYPNPTKGLLNIAYSGSEPLQITLYNQVGHMVGRYEGVHVLDLSQLAQGMYFAKIANSQGSVTRKIVVE